MKKVVSETIFSVIFYTLLAIALSSLYVSMIKTLESIRNNEFELYINLIPWAILILFSIPWAIYSVKTRNKNKPFLSFMFTMTEYGESDERETIITNKATRAGFTTYGITIPIFMVFLLFHPIINSTFPSYPIFLLAAILNISTIVYGVVWVREYRK